MFYVIYKITNQIDGKFYIGSHKTKDLNDNYMGSGKYLKLAQEKYGIENFKREILFVFDTPELMYEKEAEIVNEEFLATENTYNLKVGGFGGWDYNNTPDGQKLREHSYPKWREAGTNAFINRLNDPIFKEQNQSHMRSISGLGNNACREKYPKGTFNGKQHTDEYKRYMSSIMKEKSKGSNNSQYGTIWICNGTESKKIKKEAPIPEGWYKGRKMK